MKKNRSVLKEDAVTEIMLEIFRINGRLLEKGDEMVAPLELSSARWQVLGAIAIAARPLTIPQIGEAMGITRQGALKQLKKLQEEGFVCQQPNPRHERSSFFTLTPKGERAYEQAIQLQSAWANKLATFFSSEELDNTLQTLKSFYIQLDRPVPRKGDM